MMSASKLKPYPKYKSRKLGWINRIPSHWSIKKIKHLSTVENSGVFGLESGKAEFDYPVCTTAHISTNSEFDVPRMPVRSFSDKEQSKYVGCLGDIFVVKSSGSNTNIISGKLGLIKHDTPKMVFSNFLMRIRPLTTLVNPQFLAFFLGSDLTKQRIKRMVATTTYPNINVPDYVDSNIPLPPLDDQATISNFVSKIESSTISINRLLRKQIQLLEEKRSCLIAGVVSQGLNPDVQLKETGFGWIKQIPEHWSISRIGRIHRQTKDSFIDGDWLESPQIEKDGEFRYLTSGNIGNGFFKNQGSGHISERTFLELGCTEVFPGDLVISRLSLPVGRSCVIPDLGKRIVTAVDNVIFRLDDGFDKYYYNYLFNSTRSYENTNKLARGTTLQRISRRMLGKIETLVPPIDEQKLIVEFLNPRCTAIQKQIRILEELIMKISEYRTSLISGAVTGKIDVRGL